MDQRCNKSTIPIRNLENFLRVIPPLSDADDDSNLLEKKYSVNAANFARSLPLPEQQRNEMQNRQPGQRPFIDIVRSRKPVSKSRALHSPIKIQNEVYEQTKFWENILVRALDEEFANAKAYKRRKENWWHSFHDKTKQYYAERMKLVEDFACRVFNTKNFAEVVVFACLWQGKEVFEKLRKCEAAKFMVTDPVIFSSSQMLKLHFVMGGSWTQLYRLARGLKKISNQKIQFPPVQEFVKYKRSLLLPKIRIFRNPVTQKCVGRYCDLLEVLNHSHSNREIVKQSSFFKPFRKVLSTPLILIAIHGDGTNQTKDLELLNFGFRMLNLGRVARNPAAMQLLLLEAFKEHMQVFDSFFMLIRDGIKEASTIGIKVICLGDDCELCAAGIAFVIVADSEGKYHNVRCIFFTFMIGRQCIFHFQSKMVYVTHVLLT